MTVNECIQYIDSIEPNAYKSKQKAAWLSEIEGRVFAELFLLPPNEYVQIVGETTPDRALSLPAPYDRIYPRYLQAMIHYANGEYKRYANSMAEFNEAWSLVNRWFGGEFDVADRWRNQRVEARVKTSSADGESIIYEVPEGCALVGGRIIVRTAATFGENSYFLKEELAAGTYNVVVDRQWYHFVTERAYPVGTVIYCDLRIPNAFKAWAPGEASDTLDWGSWKDPDGTEIPDWTEPIPITFWDEEVTAFDPGMRGASPLPMLIAERGGAQLKAAPAGRSNLRTWWNDDGEIIFTAKLLISDEEFFYHGRRPWQN